MWWVGGQMDGDGCVMIVGGCSVCLSFGKAAKGVVTLHRLQTLFGGQVYNQSAATAVSQKVLQWHLVGIEAQSLCARLAPYTFIKRPQLQLAAEWPRIGTGRSGSSDVKAKRLAIDTELRRLKRQEHPTISEHVPAAYIAGFFDAEGCIYVKQKTVQIFVVQKYPAILSCFRKQFGGSVYQKKTVFTYYAGGKSGRAFMQAIAPYLCEKLPQWTLVLNIHNDPDTVTKLKLLKGHQKV